MSTPAIINLEKLLDTPRDGPLLRFSLGNEYLKIKEIEKAVAFFKATLDRDPFYSAAWKQLGHALLAAGKTKDALLCWLEGARVAEQRGDKQAAKEMAVFARRIQKQLETG